VAKIAIPVGTGQLVRHFTRDSRLEELDVPAGLLYTLNLKMAIRLTNMVATTAPKRHIVFDRAFNQYAVVIKWIGTKRSAAKSTLLRAEEVEVPPNPKSNSPSKPNTQSNWNSDEKLFGRKASPRRKGSIDGDLRRIVIGIGTRERLE
jgi:hypothetical protein